MRVLALAGLAILALATACGGDGGAGRTPPSATPITGASATRTSPSGGAALGRLPMTKAAFITRRDGKGELYSLDRDGRQVNLSNTPEEETNPDWSPDGTKIAFSSNRSGDYNIYVANADDSDVVRLTAAAAGDLSPRWSPDGRRIAFSRGGSLMAMDSDGNNVRLILAAKSERTASTLCETGGFVGGWSPDGSSITYYAASLDKGIGHICVVDVDGSNLRTVLSEPPGYLVEPSWSPDGQRIVYRSIRDGNHEIYVVNVDGSGDTNLTNDAATDLEPDWSPDGQWIIFGSDRSGDFELYAMRSDGSEVTRLTDTPGKDSDPSWSPK